MRLSHDPLKTHASFDDPNLVSRAGLVPVMALAERAGLAVIVREHVSVGGSSGVNAHLKAGCLVAGMAAGRTRSMTWTYCATAPCRRCLAGSGHRPQGTGAQARAYHAGDAALGTADSVNSARLNADSTDRLGAGPAGIRTAGA